MHALRLVFIIAHQWSLVLAITDVIVRFDVLGKMVRLLLGGCMCLNGLSTSSSPYFVYVFHICTLYGVLRMVGDVNAKPPAPPVSDTTY